MIRTRPLVGLLLAALAAGGAVSTMSSPTVANPAFHVSGTALAAAEPPLVQGLVVDQQGRFLNNAVVEAVRKDGSVAATALTYASTREDGPQNGYFYLEVGKRGVYTLTISKAGYQKRSYGPVEITRLRQKLGLGEIELKRAQAPTTAKAQLPSAHITSDARGKVVVTVAATGTSRPTGDVEVRLGRKVLGSDELTARDKGRATVTLKRLDPGSYTLKAYYLGSKTLKASSSKSVTLTVKKPRRHH
ncbi:Ig-like domain repeat protein [Nocardioides sp. MAHUQ-72]|uniref:Ig-like domain repeat protein n=1 Tax=unclassified Nocardioides TaxID=2615069 RepID=UPI003609354D